MYHTDESGKLGISEPIFICIFMKSHLFKKSIFHTKPDIHILNSQDDTYKLGSVAFNNHSFSLKSSTFYSCFKVHVSQDKVESTSYYGCYVNFLSTEDSKNQMDIFYLYTKNNTNQNGFLLSTEDY